MKANEKHKNQITPKFQIFSFLKKLFDSSSFTRGRKTIFQHGKLEKPQSYFIFSFPFSME
jgi:hypothetical protein